MPDPQATAIAFQEAIDALRARIAIGADEWLKILAEEGVISSAVADDLVRSVTEQLAAAVLDILETGGTLEDFRKRYDAIIASAGWSYHGDAGWHSEMVFRLHTGTAQAAGRWEQAKRLQEARPDRPVYLRYVTIGDHRVRPNHRAWDGVILPMDHPFWLTHLPPNGFNCRCHFEVVTARSLERYGWEVTADADPRLAIQPDQGWAFNPGTATERLRQVERAASRR